MNFDYNPLSNQTHHSPHLVVHKKDKNKRCVAMGLAAALGLTLCLGPIIFIIILTQVQTAKVGCDNNAIMELVKPCDDIIGRMLSKDSRKSTQHPRLRCCTKLVMTWCIEIAFDHEKCYGQLDKNLILDHVRSQTQVLQSKIFIPNLEHSCQLSGVSKCTNFTEMFRSELLKSPVSSVMQTAFHRMDPTSENEFVYSTGNPATTQSLLQPTSNFVIDVRMDLDVYNESDDSDNVDIELIGDMVVKHSEYEVSEIEENSDDEDSIPAKLKTSNGFRSNVTKNRPINTTSTQSSNDWKSNLARKMEIIKNLNSELIVVSNFLKSQKNRDNQEDELDMKMDLFMDGESNTNGPSDEISELVRDEERNESNESDSDDALTTHIPASNVSDSADYRSISVNVLMLILVNLCIL